jgi:hypothetical protein
MSLNSVCHSTHTNGEHVAVEVLSPDCVRKQHIQRGVEFSEKEPIMRFAVIHCRNPECGQHVWVPENKLGVRGRCPECRHVVDTPADVPHDELIDGPPVIQDYDDAGVSLADAR